MVPDWLVPLLIFLLSLVLVALWFRLRARRRAELAAGADAANTEDGAVAANPAGGSEPEASGEPHASESFPPEIMAVREELARIRAEEEAEAEQARAAEEAQAAAMTAVASAREEGAPEEEDPVVSEPEVAEVSDGPKEGPEELADEPGEPGDGTQAEDATGKPIDESSEVQLVEEAPDEPEAQENAAEQSPDEGAGDEYDADGRLVLPMAMGDVIVSTEMPRRLKLTVNRQWPIPVVQGFRPEAERLVVFYDGPEPTDIVMLPTVENTWQISLGGRPVVQVDCPDGPEALGTALRIRPKPQS
ncbi:hypothetical protein [Vannielia litorea]|uniref:Uncharacterized protein n=1 Tax=Vannielia litorea TaxID=1217970 RepID=A0A1N6HA95_9RHOB|nr:hypothetical protein [Vannielia litorea]SIO16758.1 hypothetical protein SAMN05444002_3214 [Vannielia litorea]